MSLHSLIVGLKPKTILFIIIVIGLIISITFNILNAKQVPIPTPAEISAKTSSTQSNWKFILSVISIPVSVALFALFMVYNYDKFFNTTLNDVIPISDICSILPGTNNAVSRIPSYYLAHLSFFLSYLFMNAYDTFNIQSNSSIDPSLVKNRQYRSVVIMVVLTVVLFGITLLRYFTSNCDSPLGILVTISVFTFAGFAWYKLAEYCGARNSDLLGISQSLLPNNVNTPVLCAKTT